MAIINLVTEIKTPIERCFDLSRSIDLHTLSTSKTNEQAIAGVTSGLIGLNETVTWRAKHFWIHQKLTSKITEYQFPDFFKDEMISGTFKRLEHMHSFKSEGDQTIMTDHFEFEAPLGVLGKWAEKWFLTNYLGKFLYERNMTLKNIAESSDWRKFLPSTTPG